MIEWPEARGSVVECWPLVDQVGMRLRRSGRDAAGSLCEMVGRMISGVGAGKGPKKVKSWRWGMSVVR